MRYATILSVVLATACTTPNDPALASLESEVRRLRTDQERMASQIDQINNRLVLTEDTARAARTATEADPRRRTINLGAEATHAEPIRVDSTTRGDTAEDEGDTSNLPTLRVQRGDRPPDPAGFSVRPPNERLPVVPLPPPPGAPAAPSSGGARGPSAEVIPVAPAMVAAPAGAGSAGSLDPHASPAYDDALRLARGGHCPQAIESFTRFLVRWPDHPHADNAMYWRAECILRGGDRHRAIAEFEGLLARFPAGNKVPDTLYKLAVTYERTGDRGAAERATQRLTTEFPDSEAARRIRAERE